MSALRRIYGRHPLHLLAVLASFAVAGAAIVHLDAARAPRTLAVWFAGAIVLHDFVLYPVYALADRVAVAAGARARRRGRTSVTNYLRIPTALSALALLVSFPLVLGLAEHYQDTTALSLQPFLGRWLALSGGLFAGSAVLYALNRARRSGAAPASPRDRPPGGRGHRGGRPSSGTDGG